MSKPLVVSIPHQLDRQEAVRRIKSGLASVRTHYSSFFTIQEESWNGDRVGFNIRAMGQNVVGSIEVANDHVRLEVILPWLLAKIAQRLARAIRKEGADARKEVTVR